MDSVTAFQAACGATLVADDPRKHGEVRNFDAHYVACPLSNGALARREWCRPHPTCPHAPSAAAAESAEVPPSGVAADEEDAPDENGPGSGEVAAPEINPVLPCGSRASKLTPAVGPWSRANFVQCQVTGDDVLRMSCAAADGPCTWVDQHAEERPGFEVGVQAVEVSRIRLGQRLRPVDEGTVVGLVESIRVSGLLQPILVNTAGILGAGAHRLEAVKRLGWSTVTAKVLDLDEAGMRLVEVDENLQRNELSVLEVAEHIVLREELLTAAGARARSGENQHSGGGGTVPPPRTTAQLADEVGRSERSYKRYRRIGAIEPEVRDLLKGHGLVSSTTKLEGLARLSPDAQMAEARRWTGLDVDDTRDDGEDTNGHEREGAPIQAPTPTPAPTVPIPPPSLSLPTAAAVAANGVRAALDEIADWDCMVYLLVTGPDEHETKFMVDSDVLKHAMEQGYLTPADVLEDVLGDLRELE